MGADKKTDLSNESKNDLGFVALILIRWEMCCFECKRCEKFSSALSACDKYSFQADPRFAWVDEMENDELYRKIISLPERDLDLLTLIAFEGYSQREVAEIRGIAPAAICKKVAKLKKLLYGG